MIKDLSPKLSGVFLKVLLVSDYFIKLNAFNNCVLLLFTDIKSSSILINVLSDKVGVCRKAFALLDAVIKPTRGLDSAMEVFREANFDAFRFYLISKAFMLVNDETTILSDFFTQLLIERTARNVKC